MIRKTFLRILSFFYPVTCSSCGTELSPVSKERICPKCARSMPLIKGLVCQKCGLPLDDGGEHCFVCRHKPKEFYFDKMRSSYIYAGNLRKIVLKFKYSDRMFLAADLSLQMVKTVRENDFFKDADAIIPVPLNVLRRVKRGYNQAELLALEISKHISKPVIKNVLLRKKITKPQFKLSKEERFENIKDSFTTRNAGLVKKKNIMLVDDIATTSATASACAKALKEAGCGKVYVITLARD